MSAGPISQFNTSEVTSKVRSAATSVTLEYRTLARTGYIIASRPSAIGSDTDPILMVSSTSFRPGSHRPKARPRPIAVRIHTGRKRPRTDNRVRTAASIGYGAEASNCGIINQSLLRRECTAFAVEAGRSLAGDSPDVRGVPNSFHSILTPSRGLPPAAHGARSRRGGSPPSGPGGTPPPDRPPATPASDTTAGSRRSRSPPATHIRNAAHAPTRPGCEAGSGPPRQRIGLRPNRERLIQQSLKSSRNLRRVAAATSG